MNMMSLQDLMQAERQLREFRTYATDERVMKALRKENRGVYDEAVSHLVEQLRESHPDVYEAVMQSLYDEVARRQSARAHKNQKSVEVEQTTPSEDVNEVVEYGNTE